ncbi:hypothetical protein JCM3765_001820 [Sporobolomyces pararoseus]
MSTSLLIITTLFFLLVSVSAAPFPAATATSYLNRALISQRQYVPGVSVPFFPENIPSCQACQPNWEGISSCAAAAPAFEMLFNPASFYIAIKCGCTDTFNSAYPQCVDCFVQTNQCQEFLGVPSEQNASSILDGIRNVCGFGSALIGGVAKSQSSAGISYTYTGVPSQGYSIATSTGVRALDYGSAQGASSAAARSGEIAKVGISALIFFVASVYLLF